MALTFSASGRFFASSYSDSHSALSWPGKYINPNSSTIPTAYTTIPQPFSNPVSRRPVPQPLTRLVERAENSLSSASNIPWPKMDLYTYMPSTSDHLCLLLSDWHILTLTVSANGTTPPLTIPRTYKTGALKRHLCPAQTQTFLAGPPNQT